MSTTDDALFEEVCLKSNKRNKYLKLTGKYPLVQGSVKAFTPSNILNFFRTLIYDVFLPRGYPDSVSSDYANYQIWDTLQACCSTFSGMLAVQSVLHGVGVGRESATPLAAAIAWFTKDGVGMLSGIVFAWSRGCFLDSKCKKWRLFADFINDLALCLELSISTQIERAVSLLCVSSALKAIVGVAGGATRAALTHHQAARGNTADVAAKDGSQETLVNLISMSIGVWLLHTSFVQVNAWTIMSVMVGLHLFCNFKAVKSLRLRKFNEERYLLTVDAYLTTGLIPTVEMVNLEESVILGTGISSKDLCGYSIRIGDSIRRCKIPSADLQLNASSNESDNYLILADEVANTLYVPIRARAKDQDMLKAYFHAFVLANIMRGDELSSKVFQRIMEKSKDDQTQPIFITSHKAISEEFENFKSFCEEQDWNMTEHVLHVEQWRAEWNEKKKSV